MTGRDSRLMVRDGKAVVAVVTSDGEVVSACKRRLAFSWAEVRAVPPIVEIAGALAAAGARVTVLDMRRPTPMMSRHLRRICEHAALAHVPVIVIDPSGSMGFDSSPFACVRAVDSEEFPAMVESAARASFSFEKAFGSKTEPSPVASEGASARFLDHIRKITGLTLEKSSAAAAIETMKKRIFALKMTSLWEYLNFLQFSDTDGREFQRLAAAFTVAETAFFRTSSHFHALRRVVIPDLLAAKKRERSKLRVWSAGCATGEEPYSMAIAFRQEMQDIDGWDFQVIATDLSESSLARAREGVYRGKDVQRVPKDILEQFFTRMGEDYIVDKSVRKFVRFFPLNLNSGQKHWGFDGIEPGVDVIFCENVIIYFDRPTIENLLKRFHNVLSPGGYLFLGYSESLYKIDHPFADASFQDTFFYRKEMNAAETRQSGAKRATTALRRAAANHVPPPPPKVPVAVEGWEGGDEVALDVLPAARSPDEAALMANEAAADAAAEGVDVSPDAAEAWAYARLGRVEDAGAAVAAILESRPLDHLAHYLKSLVSEARGDFAAAIADLGRALFLEQRFVPALVRMGDLLERQGNKAGALIRFRNALRLLEEGERAIALTLEGIITSKGLLRICEEAVSALECEEEK